jgi:4-amino-4-deoxy-L-arabinose transferase-like glycosyltransferase
VRIGWAIVLLTLLGFGLRAYALQTLPLIIDEIGFVAHASDILHGQHVPIFAPGHNSNPSVYSWLMAGSMDVFGQNVFAMRLLPLIFGALSIPAAYRLGRAWYSPRVGLFAAAFLATFPAHVFNSRLTLYDIADPLFALLSLAFLVRGLTPPPNPLPVHGEGERNRYLLLAAIFAACAQYFYHGSRLLLMLMAAYVLMTLGLNRHRWRAAFPGLWRMAFAGIILTLPMFLPRLVHGLPLTGNINPLTLPTDLAENSLRAVLAWVGQPDVSPFWLSASPLLPIPALMAFLAAILLLRPRDARYWTLLLSLALATIFTGAILTAAPLYVRYLVALPALVLLVGVGVQIIARFIGRGFQLNAPTIRMLEITIIALICIHGLWMSLQHPDEALRRITPSQWQEQTLAQQAAALPSGASVVLVVPPEFNEVQRITVAHMVAALGKRRAVAVNFSQPTRLQAQMRLLPGVSVVLRVE